MKIKICGLRRAEDIQAVNKARPDYCGFIVEYPRSRRSVTEEQLRELVKGLDHEIIPVGVFVNAPLELPAGLLEDGTIAMAQLHGQEDEEYIAALKERTKKQIIKAFSIRTAEDVRCALSSRADYILLDQGSGGTGQTFDWSLVSEINRPYFLAGGLGVDNLGKAESLLHPWAVDLSSSLETDGYKDEQKILDAVSRARLLISM